MKTFIKIFFIFLSLFLALGNNVDYVESFYSYPQEQNIYASYNVNENSIVKPHNSENLTSAINIQTHEGGNSVQKSYVKNKFIIDYIKKNNKFSFYNKENNSDYLRNIICTRAP